MRRSRLPHLPRTLRRLATVVAVSTVTAVGLSLASCGSGGHTGGSDGDGSLVVAMDPRKIDGPFDPIKGWAFTGVTLFQSTLNRIDGDNRIVGDLATDHEVTNGGLTWTYAIRDDATFSDGSAVTAADVAFTYRTARDESTSVDLTNLADATATDDTHVRFDLKTPDSVFGHVTTVLGIVPEHAYGDGYGENPVGSGPFILDSYTPAQQIVMHPNPDYYGTRSPFTKVTIVMMQPDAALAAAQAGSVDVATVNESLVDTDVAGFTGRSLDTWGYRTISLPTATPHTTADGALAGNDVTSDRDLRRAMASAVNRQEIVDGALDGVGSPAFDAFDRLPWGLTEDEEKDLVDGDTAAAEAILDRSGWRIGDDGVRVRAGRRAEFNLLYPPSDSGRQAIAEQFSQQMSRIGVAVHPVGMELDEMKKTGRNRTDAVVLGGGDFNPVKLYSSLTSRAADSVGWNNVAGYSNSTVDGYLEQARREQDPEASYDLWRKALWDGRTGGSVLGDNPYITLGFIKDNYLVSNGLDLGHQKIHPHDHSVSLLANLTEWTWS